LFKLSFLVEDKNLPKVLHAVAGYALNMETPQPVGNTVVKKGKVKAKANGTSMPDLIAHELQVEMPDSSVTSSHLKKLLVKAGGAETSYNYLIKALVKRRVISSTSRGMYSINR
jgi:hypothetical protein